MAGPVGMEEEGMDTEGMEEEGMEADGMEEGGMEEEGMEAEGKLEQASEGSKRASPCTVSVSSRCIM